MSEQQSQKSSVLVYVIVGVLLLGALVTGVAGFVVWKMWTPQSAEIQIATVDLPKLAPKSAVFYGMSDYEKMGVTPEFAYQLFDAVMLSKPEDYDEFKIKFKDATSFEWNELSMKMILPKRAAVFLSAKSDFDPSQADVSDVEDFFMAAELSDSAKAISFMSTWTKSWAEKNALNVKEESIDGNLIFSLLNAESSKVEFSWAFRSGWLFVGKNPKSLTSAWARLKNSSESLTENAAYKDFLAHTQPEVALTFVDLTSLAKKESTDVYTKALFKSLRWLGLGLKMGADQTFHSNLFVRVQPEATDIHKNFFPALSSFAFKSPSIVGETTETFSAINLKSLYDTVYDAMSRDPANATKKDTVKTLLSMQGIDLDNDVWGALTGEVAISIEGLAEFQKLQNQFPSPQQFLMAVSQSDKINLSLIFMVNDQAKADALLQKLAGPFLLGAESIEHNGVKYFNMQGLTFGFANGAFALVLGKDAMPKFIDAAKQTRVAQNKLYQAVAAKLSEAPLYVAYSNGSIAGESMPGISKELLKILSSKKINSSQGLVFAKDGLQLETWLQFQNP